MQPLGEDPLLPLAYAPGPSAPEISETFYMRAHGMRKSSQYVRALFSRTVTGYLSEGSFVRIGVVEIPKFDAKPNSNLNPNSNPNPNPDPNPMPIRFGHDPSDK